ncbi:mitochondrial ribosomal protein L33, isoform CRA_c, partial [Mus musculus]
PAGPEVEPGGVEDLARRLPPRGAPPGLVRRRREPRRPLQGCPKNVYWPLWYYPAAWLLADILIRVSISGDFAAVCKVQTRAVLQYKYLHYRRVGIEQILLRTMLRWQTTVDYTKTTTTTKHS